MANRFKIKNGLVIDSAEVELVNVSGPNDVLLSTSNETNGNIDINTTYANTLETQKENIAARENGFATVAGITYENVVVPLHSVSATSPGMTITMGEGGPQVEFVSAQNLIQNGDTYVTLTTQCGLTATLPICYPCGGVSPYYIVVGPGQEATDFYNAAMACNAVGSRALLYEVFSKPIAQHTEYTKVITFDKPIYDLDPSGTFYVDSAPDKYVLSSDSITDPDRYNRLWPSWPITSPSLPTNLDWTIEMELSPYLGRKEIQWIAYADLVFTGATMYFNGVDYPLPAGTQDTTAMYTIQYQYTTGRTTLNVNGQLVFDVVTGYANTDWNPFSSNVSCGILGNLSQINISSSIAHTMGSSWTPPATLSRDANTKLLFTGSIPEVSALTPIIRNYQQSSSSYIQNPITKTYFIQDPITLYGLSVCDDDGGDFQPVINANASAVDFIGLKYSTLPNKYISGISTYYNVGDVVKYIPSNLSINFIAKDSANNKSISFNTDTGDIEYQGFPYALTVDNVNRNIYTNAIGTDGVALKPISTSTTMLITTNGTIAGYNADNFDNSVIIGNNMGTATGWAKVCIGANANSMENSVAIGPQAYAYYGYGVALGANSSALGLGGVALGSGVNVTGTNSMGLGYYSYVDWSVSNSIAIGAWSGVYNSYTMSTNTSTSQYYPNSKLSFNYYYNGQALISNGNWYISKIGVGYSATAYTSENYASNIPSMFRSRNYQTPIGSAYGVATVIAKRNTSPTEWKIWEIKFYTYGTSNNNATTDLTIISNTVVAQGGGAASNSWSVTLENISNFLNVKFTQTQVQSNYISITANIECQVLNGYS